MVEIEVLLKLAKMGNKEALMKLIEMYRPLLINYSMICGRFDEDLYYEQLHTMIRCIHKFTKRLYIVIAGAVMHHILR